MYEEYEYFSEIDDESQLDENDPEVMIENEYYTAKILLEENKLDEAAEKLESVIQMERITTQSRWTFKSLKKLTKMYVKHFSAIARNGTTSTPSSNNKVLHEQNAEKVILYYTRLLKCIIDGAVKKNLVEKAILSILNKVGSETQTNYQYYNFLKDFYSMTIKTFNSQTGAFHSQHLWLRASIALGDLSYEMNNIAMLKAVIQDIFQTIQCTSHSNNTDVIVPRFGNIISETDIMEIYALQLKMYSKLHDNVKVKETFNRIESIQGGLPHPRTLGIIQELGGKMLMENYDLKAASKALFRAFLYYDELGDDRKRLRILKIFVMASVLDDSSTSTMSYLDFKEAAQYKHHPEIVNIAHVTKLVALAQVQDPEYERKIQEYQDRVGNDEFIHNYFQHFIPNLRGRYLFNQFDDKILKDIQNFISPTDYLNFGLVNKRCYHIYKIYNLQKQLFFYWNQWRKCSVFYLKVGLSIMRKNPKELLSWVIHTKEEKFIREVCYLIAQAGIIEILKEIFDSVQEDLLKVLKNDVKICAHAAEGNQLFVLRWLRSENFLCDFSSCLGAVRRGNLEVVQFLYTKKDLSWPQDHFPLFIAAAEGAHLHVMHWLRFNSYEWHHPFPHSYWKRNPKTCEVASKNGHYAVVEYLHKNGFTWNSTACLAAISGGHLAVLKYLRTHSKEWDNSPQFVIAAAKGGFLEIIQYLEENGCAWSEEAQKEAASAGHDECAQYLQRKW